MLVITRKKGQKVVISGDIEITILDVGRNRVRFGVNAPKHVMIQTRVNPLPAEIPGKIEVAEAPPIQRKATFAGVIEFSKRS